MPNRRAAPNDGVLVKHKSPLGPQCWTCRQRRIRCESQLPTCSNCRQKGLDCLGYSPIKPVKWRAVQAAVRAQALMPYCAREDDIFPARTSLDAIYYYNSTMGRDMGAFMSVREMIAPSEWVSCWSNTSKLLLTCIVRFHQLLQSLPPDFHDLDALPWHELDEKARDNVMVISRHQAEAARQVQQRLLNIQKGTPDPDLFCDIVFMLDTHIQQGAFSLGRNHVQGANALLAGWGDPAVTCIDDEIHYILMSADIFQTTTTASTNFSSMTWEQHADYLKRLPDLDVDLMIESFAPVPRDLLIVTTMINMSRMPASPSSNCGLTCQKDNFKLPLILDRIQAFCPQTWGKEMAHHPRSSPDLGLSRVQYQLDWQKSWLALAQCFKSAITLYLFLSMEPLTLAQNDANLQLRIEAYGGLINAITYLFTRRETNFSSSRHHKFVAWPMTIAGVEAIVMHHDYSRAERMSSWLRTLTFELGSLGMRLAARTLDSVSMEYQMKGPAYRYNGADDWGLIFKDGPALLY